MPKKEEFINFDMYAEHYDDTRAVSPNILRLFGNKLKEMTMNKNSILEIGCGTGRITKGLIESGFSVTGIDVSENMIQKAILKASKHSWEFSGILGDARFTPIKKGVFDSVITLHILHLIRDWKKVIAEIFRCLSPYGVYINSEFSRNYYQTPPFVEYWNFFSKHYDTTKTNRIGIKNYKEIDEYLKNYGYTNSYYDYNKDIKVNKKILIQMLDRRYLSSQRNIEDEKHNKAINHLKKNNYFLPENEIEVTVSEGFKIWTYKKNI